MKILPLVISLSFAVLTFLFLRHRRRCAANLPSGTFGWSIIGETLDFHSGTPEKFIADRMKKYSPDIFKTKILGEKTVVICGPDGHKFLFSNDQKLFTVFRPHPMQHIFPSYKTKATATLRRNEISDPAAGLLKTRSPNATSRENGFNFTNPN